MQLNQLYGKSGNKRNIFDRDAHKDYIVLKISVLFSFFRTFYKIA